MKVKVPQSCPTLCDPMNYTVHGILQAEILEWVTIPFSRGSSQPRDQTHISCTAGGFFTRWATREVRWRLTFKPLCQKNEELNSNHVQETLDLSLHFLVHVLFLLIPLEWAHPVCPCMPWCETSPDKKLSVSEQQDQLAICRAPGLMELRAV